MQRVEKRPNEKWSGGVLVNLWENKMFWKEIKGVQKKKKEVGTSVKLGSCNR